MDIKQVKISENIKLNLIHTKKFKTVTLKILFKGKAIKKEATALSVLASILNESSKTYKTLKELSVKKEELYGTDIDAILVILEKLIFLEYVLILLIQNMYTKMIAFLIKFF